MPAPPFPPAGASAPLAIPLARLAEMLGARLGAVPGEEEKPIRGVAALQDAGPDQLSFLANPRYRDMLRETRAGAVIVSPGEQVPRGVAALTVDDPYPAFARALAIFHPPRRRRPGISANAHVDATAAIGEGAEIHPGAFVGPGCSLGPRATLHPGAVLVEEVVAGEDLVVHPNVTIYPGTRLGDRVTIHAGSVLGSDGFGYAQSGGRHVKVPQVGRVVVEDDVEIGACVTVDRATLGETRIGAGTKIDNLVQVGHNVKLGEACILVSQVGIAGSTEIGSGTMIAGQSGVAGHLRVGRGVRIGAKSAVLQDVPDGGFVTGIPAMAHRTWLRLARLQERLPDLLRKLLAHPVEDESTGDPS